MFSYKLSFIVVTIPERVRYPSGVQYLAPYGQTLVGLAVHAIGASDTLWLLGRFLSHSSSLL